MRKYLNDRIAYLRRIEREYFDKSFCPSSTPSEKRLYRESSNEFMGRRMELELVLKEL